MTIFKKKKKAKCFGIENYNDLGCIVEADESFYVGLNKKCHKDKKIKNSQGRAYVDKTLVLGPLKRDGKLATVVRKALQEEK